MIRHRTFFVRLAAALAALAIERTILTGFAVAASPPSTSKLDGELSREFKTDVQPLLKKFCFDCHEGASAESSVDLSIYKTLESIRLHPSQWEQVRGIVRIGAMPPPDFDAQPTQAERETISQWTYRALHAFDCSEPNPPSPITVRRLNSAEYDLTIRDLLGLDIAPSKTIGFVSDDVGNGFDNQGEVLSISPLSLEKYVKAAEWISQQAVVLDRDALREQSGTGDPLRVGEKFASRFLFSEGEYVIKTRVRYGRKDGQVRAAIFVDGEEIDDFNVPGTGRSMEWKRNFTAGEHQIHIQFLEDPDEDLRKVRDATVTLDRIAVVGPTKGQPPMPLHHQRLMVAAPDDELSAEDAASKIIDNLLPKAFRRPISPVQHERILNVFRQAQQGGSGFGESIQYALQAILVSPEFLFRLEPSSDALASPMADSKSTPQPSLSPLSEVPIDAYELATRLSYFLWSTMPDERLFELAGKGTLTDSNVLEAEIARMLASPKSDALVMGFFDQWLGMRNLQTVTVDENAFEIWSDKLSAAIAKETFLFCQDMLREGSLRDVLDADYTFVNPRLADFYGLPFDGEDPAQLYTGSSRSSEFERRLGNYRDEERWLRVDLPKNRRGLLTHASILTLTSNPTRTSPVKRGKWVLENILGDPPPPAPPGVPSLEEADAENPNRSLRETLEIHRANPSCASCHRVLDPIGLGLENFDAIGRWRTTDEGSKIDAQGELADGRKFSGPRELLERLQVDEPKIARHFASQLLTYALGRGLTRGDSCTLDSIVAQATEDDLRISAFIVAIVECKPFRYVTRRSTDPSSP